MKLSVDRKLLQEVVSALAPLAKKNSPKEILKYLHFEANDGLTVFATNLEQGASRTISADVIECGRCLIDSTVILKFLNCSIDDTIHLAVTDAGVLITSARAKVKCLTAKVEDYPAMFEPSGDLEFRAGMNLRTMFSPIALASRGDQERSASYALDSICLSLSDGTLWLVCTDGAKIAVAPIQAVAGENRDLLLPIPAIRLLESQWKTGEAEVRASNNVIYFSGPGWTAYTRLIEGRYPRWKNAMEAGEGDLVKATVDVAGLRRIVDTAIIGLDKTTVTGWLLGTPGSITVRAGKSPNECEAFIPVAGSGEAAMELDLQYMKAAVTSFGHCDSIELKISERKKLVLKSDSHTFLIMGCNK